MQFSFRKGKRMRSYLEIICDVKDGKHIDYDELRLALLYNNDQHFFTKQRLERYLTAKKINPLVQTLDRESQNQVFKIDKQPLEKWWKGEPPKENT